MADDDKPKGDGYKLTEDPAFQELQKQLKGLGILVTQQQQQGSKLTESVNTLVQKMDQSLEGKRDDVRHISPEDQEEAINDLDNNQLVKLVLSEVGKALDEKLGKVSDKLDETNNRVGASEVRKQIEDLNAKDFFDWKEEMTVLAKANPGLSPSQLYSLVRSENPEKAADLDKKYQDKGDDKDTGKFVGLMPTSGATLDTDEKLTSKEAADAAWDDIVQDFPELAAGEG